MLIMRQKWIMVAGGWCMLLRFQEMGSFSFISLMTHPDLAISIIVKCPPVLFPLLRCTSKELKNSIDCSYKPLMYMLVRHLQKVPFQRAWLCQALSCRVVDEEGHINDSIMQELSLFIRNLQWHASKNNLTLGGYAYVPFMYLGYFLEQQEMRIHALELKKVWRILISSCSLNRFYHSPPALDANAQDIIFWFNHLTHEEWVWLMTRFPLIIRLCVEEGIVPLVLRLIEEGACLEYKARNNQTPLMLAIMNDHAVLVTLLLSSKASHEVYDLKMYTPLMYAAKIGNAATVQALIEAKSSLCAHNEQGVTPLMIAAGEGHSRIIKILLAQGAGINESNALQMSALYYAVRNNQESAVRTLLSHNAYLEIKNQSDDTPLLYALRLRKKKMIPLLLEFNANVCARDTHGNTPLMIASLQGDRESVARLIEYKSDMRARNNDDCTPLALAAYKGYTTLVTLLLEWEAQKKKSDQENFKKDRR